MDEHELEVVDEFLVAAEEDEKEKNPDDWQDDDDEEPDKDDWGEGDYDWSDKDDDD